MRTRVMLATLLVAAGCSGGEAGDTATVAPTVASTVEPSSTTTEAATSATTRAPATTTTTAATAARSGTVLTAAVSASREFPGFPAEHAVDGDPDTWWGAGDFPPQTLALDFGGTVTVTSLELMVSQDPRGETTHQIIGDGTVLETVVSETADLDVIAVTPQPSWEGVTRLEVRTLESPSWVGWREITVRGVATGEVAAAPPDVIFTGGPIVTMSAAGTVDALAVTAGTISAVGSGDEVLAAAGPRTRIIDLAGRAVLPGFVDPHTHILNDAWRIDRDTLGGQELALEHGITTLGNLFTTPEFLDEMRGHDEAGGLRARISLYLIATDNCGVVQDDWWQSVAPTRSPGELLRIGGVKLFLDGGTCGDWATTEPIQPGGGVATPFLETAEIEAIIVAAAERGHQVVIHSIGDIATLRALDAIIATTEPANPLRHRVDHLTMVTDEVIERFGDSGAVGAVFGYYPSCGDFEVTPFFEAGVRRHQDLMAANPDAVVAWHGDDPWVGPVSPLQELHNMVTRVEIGDDGTECPPPPYLADRTFDVMTGLRMMTIDAAYALHRETEVGSLEAGKFADLVVLSADPTSVAEREIYDIEVLATIVGGHAEVCRDEAVCPPR